MKKDRRYICLRNLRVPTNLKGVSLKSVQGLSVVKYVSIILFLFSFSNFGFSQDCDGLSGNNQILNPGFEDGDDGSFFVPAPYRTKADACAATGGNPNWSCDQGVYSIVQDAVNANIEWTGVGNPNNFMAIDGARVDQLGGSSEGAFWCQNVRIDSGEFYFFSIDAITLHTDGPSDLADFKFEMQGQQFGLNFTVPATAGVWSTYVDSIQATTTGNFDLCIVNTNAENALGGNDWGIDNLEFSIGCQFGGPGPSPNVSDSISLCSPCVTISSGLEGDALAIIEWSTGETTPTIDVCDPGVYYVCTRYPGTCTKSDSVVVSNTLTATVTPDNAEMCPPVSTTLEASTTADNPTYTWRDPLGTIVSTVSSATANQYGTYTVEISAGTCPAVTYNAIVSQPDGYIPGSNYTWCFTDDGNFNFTSESITINDPNPGGSYFWYESQTGGSSIQTSPYGSQIFYPASWTGHTLAAGPKTYWVDKVGGSVCGRVPVTITESCVGDCATPYVAGEVTINPQNPATQCYGTTVTLTRQINSGAGYTFQWYEAYDDANVLSTGISLDVTSPGTYVLMYTDGGTPACSGFDTVAVNFIGGSLDLGPDIATCDPFVLDAGAGFSTYQWYYDDGTGWAPIGPPDGTGQFITRTAAGDYKVVAEHPTCGFLSDSLTVTANPGGGLTVNLGADQSGSCLTADTLYAPSGTGYVYEWEFDDGSGFSDVGSNSNFLVISDSGTYKVTVTQPGLGACQVSGSDEMEFTKEDGIFAQDVTYCPVSRGGDGIATFAITNGDPAKDYVWTTTEDQNDTIQFGTGVPFYDYTISGLTGGGFTGGDTTVWVAEMGGGAGGAAAYANADDFPDLDGNTVSNQPSSAETYTFDALSGFTLDSITLYVRAKGLGWEGIIDVAFTLTIRDNSATPIPGGTLVYSAKINDAAHNWEFISIGDYTAGGGGVINNWGTDDMYKVTLPVGGIVVPAGTAYTMEWDPNASGAYSYWDGTDDVTTYDVAGQIDITNLSGGWGATAGGAVFDWVVQAASEPCPPIPITAREECPCDPPANPGTLTGVSTCFPYTHEFVITGFAGANPPPHDDNAYVFEWYSTSSLTPITSGITLDTFSVSTAGDYFVVIKDTSELSNPDCWDTTNIASVDLTAVSAGALAADKYRVCNGDNVTLTLAPGYIGSTIEWFKSTDGGGTFSLWQTGGSSQTETGIQTSDLPFQYYVRVSEGVCRDSTNIIQIIPAGTNFKVHLNDIECGETTGEIIIYNLSVGTGINYDIDFNGGGYVNYTPTDSGIVVFNGLVPGDYNPFVLRDSLECVTTLDTTLTVIDSNVAVGSIAGDAAICYYESTVLTLSGHSGLDSTIQWYDSTDASGWQVMTDSIDADVHVSPTNGQSPARYRVIISNSQCADTTDYLVVVDSVSAPTINGPSLICEGDNINLTMAGGSIGTIAWEDSLSSGGSWGTAGLGTTTSETVTSPDADDAPIRYRAVVTNNGCTDTSNVLLVNINKVPIITKLPDADSCDQFTIPAINGTDLTGNEGYYSGTNGSGAIYNVGDVFTADATIYVYDSTTSNPSCSVQDTFEIDIHTTPVLTKLPDADSCDQYTLPTINGTDLTTNQAYYTGTNGSGTSYTAGQVLTADATIFVYDSTTTAPSCSVQDTFEIDIHATPVLTKLPDADSCDQYILPAINGTLTGNQGYYAGTNGSGATYTVGQVLTADATVFVYDSTTTDPSCSAQDTFEIDIHDTPVLTKLPDTDSCDQYTLPAINGTLTGNQGYYAGTNGSGATYNVGDVLVADATIFVYDSTTTDPSCSVQDTFEIDIHDTPILTKLPDADSCDQYTLPTIQGTLTGNQGYYVGTNGSGATYTVGQVLTSDATVFVYDSTTTDPSCSVQDTFEIDIHATPVLTKLPDADSCDQYTLPAINGTLTGNQGYYAGTNGSGATYTVGQVLTADATVFVYDSTTTDPSCNVQDTFEIDIHDTPVLTKLPDADSCDQYTLPAINGTLTGNQGYYAGTNGSGATYNVADVLTVDATIFVYDSTTTDPSCSVQDTFEIDIHDTPVLTKLPDGDSCDQYRLPAINGTLSGNQGYYGGTNGSGALYNVGDVLVADATIFVYDSTTTDPSCSVEDTFNIRIIPNVTAGDVSQDLDTICTTGSTDYTLEGSSITSGYGHTVSWWEGTSENGVYTQIAGGNITDDTVFTASYTNATTVNDTIWIYSQTEGACDTMSSDTVMLVVQPAPIGGTLSGSDICPGDSVWLVLSAHVGDSIRWEVTNEGGGVWTTINTGTVDSIRVSPSADSTYRAIVSFTGSYCDEDTSTEVTINLQAAVNKGLWANADNVLEYCTGDQATDSLNNGLGGVLWQESTDGGMTWVNYSGTETNDSTETFTYVNNTKVIDTTLIRVRYTTTCDTVFSDTLAVIVHPQPVSGILAPDTTVCPGSTIDIRLSSMQGDSIFWQSHNGATWTQIAATDYESNDTTLSITPGVDTRYRVTVRYANGICLDSISDSIVVSLDTAAVAGDIAPNTVTYCTGDNAVLELTGSNATFTDNTVEWFEGTTRSGAYAQIGAGITDEDTVFTATYTNATTVPDTMFIYSMTVAACDTAYSDTVEVIIHPEPQGGTLSGSDICPGDSVWIVLTGHAGDSIRWEGTNNGGAVWVSIPSSIDSILVSPTADSTYRAIVKYSNGVCLEDTSTTQDINLSAASITAGQWVDADNTLEYCTGSSEIDSLDGGSNVTVLWQESTDGTTWGNYSGTETNDSTETFDFTNTGTTTDTTWIRVRYATTCDTVFSDTLAVIVHPQPVSGILAPDTTVCPGSTIDIRLSSMQGDSIFWQSHNGATWTQIAATDYASNDTTLSVTINSDTTFRVVVRYANGICLDSISDSIMVSMDTSAVAGDIAPNTVTYCTGDNAVLELTGSNATFTDNTVEWFEGTTRSGVYAQIGAGITDEDTVFTATYTNVTTKPDTMWVYSMTVAACDTAYSDTVEVIIHPEPVGGTLSGSDICPGDSVWIVLTGHQGDSIRWEGTNNGGAVWVSIPSSIDSVLVGPSADSTYRAIVKYSNGVCLEDTSTTQNINLSAASITAGQWVDADNTLEYCTGSSEIDSLDGGSNVTVLWQESTDGTTWGNYSGTETNDSTETFDFTNTGTITDTTWIRVRYATTCDTVFSDTLAVIVHPQPVSGILAPDTTVCPGSTIDIRLSSMQGDSIFWQSDNGATWTQVAATDYASNDTTLSVTINSDTTFRVVVRYANGICLDSISDSITVSMDTSAVAGDIAPNTVTYCTGDNAVLELTESNATFTDNTVEWFEGTTRAGVYAQIGAGITDEDTVFTATYTNVTTAPDTMWVYSMTVAACDTAYSDTVEVIIHPEPVGGTLSGSDICPGDSVWIVLTGHAGDSIRWEVTEEGANSWSLIAGATIDSIKVSPSADSTYRVIIKYANGTCAEDTSTEQTINLSAGFLVRGLWDDADNVIEYCTGDSVTDSLSGASQVTTLWQESLDGGSTWVNYSGTETNDSTETFTYTNAGTEIDTVLVRVRYASTCDTLFSDTLSLLIHPQPDGGNILNAGAICPGDSLQLVLDNYAGDSLVWESSINLSVWTPFFSGNDSVYVDPLDTTYYRVIVRYALGECLRDTSDTVRIDIQDVIINADLNAVDTSYCTGDSIEIQANGASGTVTWQQYDGANWVAFTDGTISNDTIATVSITNAGTAIDTNYYRVKVSSTCDSAFSDSIVVIIHPQPDGGNILNAGAICPGDSLQLVLDNYAGDSLVWESSTDLSVWTAFFSGNDSVYVDPTDTSYYRVIVRYALGECLRDTSDTVRVDIQDVIINADLNAIDTSYCTGDSIEIQANGASGTVTWQQYDGANWVAFTDGAISNDTVATVSITNVGTAIDTNYYRVKVSSTCDSAFSDSIVVIVHPQPDGGNILNAGAICPGDSLQLVLDNYAGDSLVWESSSNLSAWTPFFSGNDSVYVDPLDTTYYRVIVRYALGECLRDTSDTVRVDIQDVIINADLNAVDTSYCTGDSIVIEANGASGTVTWEQYNGTNWIAFTDGTIANDTIATVSITNAGTAIDTNYYRVKVSSTCDSAFSDSIVVIVHPQPDGGVIANAIPICLGDSIELALTNYAGDSIVWEESTDLNNWTVLSGSNDSIFVTPSDTSYYRAIVRYAMGECLRDTSDTVRVGLQDVITNGVITPVLSEYCTGDSVTLTLVGASGTVEWLQLNGSTWEPFTHGSVQDDSIVHVNLTNVSLVPDTNYYKVKISSTCDSAFSDSVMVIVHPAPDAGVINSDVVCPGTYMTFNLTGYEGDSIRWETSDAGANVWSQFVSNGEDSIHFIPLVDTDVRAIVFYQGGACTEDTSSIATVTIFASAVAGDISGIDTLCMGDTTVLTLSGYTGTIQWQDSIAGGAWADMTGEVADTLALAFPTDIDPDKYYRAIVTNGNCGDTTLEHNVFVKVCCVQPVFAITDPSDPFCGDSVTISVQTDALAGFFTYEWFLASDSINAIATGVDLDTITVGLTDTFFVKITQSDLSTCFIESDSVITDIRDIATVGITAIDPSIMCVGDTAMLTVDGITGSIQWQENMGNVGSWVDLGSADNNDTIFVSPLEAESPIDYRVVVNNDVICYDTSNTVSLIVEERVMAGVISPMTDTICDSDSIDISLNGSVGMIQWQVLSGTNWVNLINDTLTTVTVNPSVVNSPVTYRAVLTNNVCDDTSGLSEITIYPLVNLNVSIAGPNSVCELAGAEFEVVDSTGGGSDPVFEWYLDGVLHTSNEAIMSYDASVTGSHEIMVIMTSDSLCARPDTTFDTTGLYVDPLLTPDIDMPLGDNRRCEDSLMRFEAMVLEPSTSGNLITWFVNDVMAQAGIDDLTYTTDELNDGDEVRVSIEVDPLGGCYTKFYDTTGSQIIFIDKAPQVGDLQIDQEVCFGEGGTVLLTNHLGDVTWTWSEDGVVWNELIQYADDTSFVFVPSQVGVHPGDSIYRVFIAAEVSNTGECLPVNSDTASLTEYPEIDAEIIVEQDCETFQLTLTTEVYDPYSFHTVWHQSDDGSNWVLNYSIEPSVYKDGMEIVDEFFIAEFSNNICVEQDTVEVVKCPDPPVEIANAMTPSDLNGQNDVFWIQNIEFYPNNRLWIYNRWGNLVFETEGYDNVNNAWDGTRIGVDMPAAVYYYILDLGNDEDHIKGTITIVR